MAEMESAHGKLSPVDQNWTAPKFIALLTGTLLVALTVLYIIASVKTGDFSYQPFAHDLVKHTIESSQL